MADRSLEDVARDFGAIVFQNEFAVVRCKTVTKAMRPDSPCMAVTVHAKNGRGIEQLPIGYVMGENILQFYKS